MSGQLNLAITGFMLLVLMATHPIQLRFADTEHLRHPSSLIALALFRTADKHVPLVLDFEVFPRWFEEDLCSEVVLWLDAGHVHVSTLGTARLDGCRTPSLTFFRMV